MKKKALLSFLGLVFILSTSTAGMCRPRYHHHPHNYRHYYHDSDALIWGMTGLVVGSLVTGIALQSSYEPRQVVYIPPPDSSPYYGAVFSYPPQVPPGMCRWERYMLDEYGRYVMGPDGQPAKQYTLGSCQYPPR